MANWLDLATREAQAKQRSGGGEDTEKESKKAGEGGKKKTENIENRVKIMSRGGGMS